MPYIITRCWYPPNKVDEVVKKYLEVLDKFPPDETLGIESRALVTSRLRLPERSSPGEILYFLQASWAKAAIFIR